MEWLAGARSATDTLCLILNFWLLDPKPFTLASFLQLHIFLCDSILGRCTKFNMLEIEELTDNSQPVQIPVAF